MPLANKTMKCDNKEKKIDLKIKVQKILFQILKNLNIFLFYKNWNTHLKQYPPKSKKFNILIFGISTYFNLISVQNLPNI